MHNVHWKFSPFIIYGIIYCPVCFYVYLTEIFQLLVEKAAMCLYSPWAKHLVYVHLHGFLLYLWSCLKCFTNMYIYELISFLVCLLRHIAKCLVYVILVYVILVYVILVYVILVYVILVYVILVYVILVYVILVYVILVYVILVYVILVYVILVYVILVYVILVYVILVYVILVYVIYLQCFPSGDYLQTVVRERETPMFKSGSIPNKWGWPDSPQPSSNLIYAKTPFGKVHLAFPGQLCSGFNLVGTFILSCCISSVFWAWKFVTKSVNWPSCK